MLSTETRERLKAARDSAPSWLLRLAGQVGDGGVRSPPKPPSCPPGWRTGPPDFVGVGAQRAGTTRWFDLLAAHPQISQQGLAKELHYFDAHYARGCSAGEIEGYERYFPREGARLVGEWTPLYMSVPWVAPLLAAAAPATKLIAILRDPVDRYASGLEHDALLARQRGRPLSELAPLEAFSRGLYHQQLTWLLRHFDRRQLLVLQHERCVLGTEQELRRTFEFLGVEDATHSPNLGARLNASRGRKPTLDPSTRRALIDAYAPDVAALLATFEEVDLSLWENFAGVVG